LPQQLAIYYKQKADWSRVGPGNASPFTLGAILATNALSLQQVCTLTHRARLAPASGKCKACKKTGGERMACNFCTAVYHNSGACLNAAEVVPTALATSPTFLWACPACFKKGVAAVQRVVLKPTTQRAAGAKKKRNGRGRGRSGRG
jgi:hypothetical protein